MVRVELDVFSGGSNPWWELTPSQAEELALRLQGMPTLGSHQHPSGLGYRGFVLRMVGESFDLFHEARVFGGVVIVECGQVAECFRDHRDVEGWLLEQARERGYGDLVPG